MKELAKTYDVPLHDIKNIVEVQEYSFYYLLGVIVLSALVLSTIVYFVFKYLQKRNEYNQRKEHFELLNLIDLNDTKSAAYGVSKYGATFANDGERQSGMYKNISARLEQFKYRKDVDSFDEETLAFIELYKGMIDV